MDTIDRTLLQLLEADSRTPLKTLAAMVGLARSTVQERIRKLEQNGVIRGYTIRICDPDPAGVEAYLWVRTASADCAAVAQKIVRLDGIHQCRSVAGDRDMVLLARCRSLEALAGLRNTIAAIEGVAEVETHPVQKDWT